MKELHKKAIMLGIAFLLLVSVLLYLSYAWYTKMTSVTHLEFQTADWNMNANENIDNFTVNVYRYPPIQNGVGDIAAPGTSGYVPIVLSAKRSDSDADYVISVNKGTMSEEFQKRIYFYTSATDFSSATEFVFTTTAERDKNVVTGTVLAGASNTEYIYWHWVYDYDEYLSINDLPLYRLVTVMHELEQTNPLNVTTICSDSDMFGKAMEGGEVFASGSNLRPYVKNEKNDKIEQWYAMTATQTDAVKAALDGDESFERFVTVWNQYLADYEAFDDFDTRVGLDPDFYEPQMAASVFITGEQVTPSQPIPSQP